MQAVFKMILMTSLYASIVGVIILGLNTLLKNKLSPKWHYLIWFVLILKLMIPFGPKSVISFFNAAPKVSQKVQNVNFEQTYREYHKTIIYMQQKKLSISRVYTVKDKSLHLAANFQKSLPYIWLFGVILMSLWLIYSNYSLHKKVRENRIIVPKTINKIFDECKGNFNISTNIKVVIQNVISTPAIFGVFKPKILLSPEIINLDDKQLSYIFLHELAHYKRKDLLVNYILLVLQAIHWFNPVIWYCFKTIRRDMEAATDEKVLNILDSDQKREYGRALLAVVENFNSLRIIPKLIGMVDDKKSMERRIKMIKMNDFIKSRRKMVIVTGILCIVILSGGLLTNAVTKPVPSAKKSNTAAASIKKASITVFTNVEKYSPLMSSTPGIGMMINYSGTADKVKYSTNYGGLSTWDRGGTWKVTECGSKVELPLNVPTYWSPLVNGKSNSAKIITINIQVLNNKQVVAQKQVNIISDDTDGISFHVDKSTVIVTKIFEADDLKAQEINQVIKDIKKLNTQEPVSDKESPKEPPKLNITIGKKEVSYVSAKNKWNGDIYTGEDTFKTMLKKVSETQIPYIKIGETAEISFKNNPPSKLEVSDIIIDNKGNQVYDKRATSKTVIEPKEGKFLYNIGVNMASGFSSYYVEDKTDIRGIRIIASWGENKCEYAFVIRTDAK